MIEDIKKNKLALAIAALDSAIISLREQQIELGKLLAKEMGHDEQAILRLLKQGSIEFLKQNGLEY